MFWPFLFLKLCYIYWHTLKPCRMVIFIFIFLLSGTFRWNFHFHLKNILTFIQWMRWKRSFGSEKIPCLSFLFIINDDTLGFLLLGFWFCFVPHLLLHFCEKSLNFVLIWQFFLTIPITFVFLLSLSLTHFYDRFCDCICYDVLVQLNLLNYASPDPRHKIQNHAKSKI